VAESPFLDPALSVDARVDDLLARLSPEEKVGQLMHRAPAIPRLGIPAYNWWNECLHGVARAGVASVFPQAIGLAATFAPDLMGRVAACISDEARAKYNTFQAEGDRGPYRGLTFWSPNINILRDPRWGRAQETYGECPWLTARLGVAFCRGLQGDHPRYLKLVATPKHFAAHSGPEPLRHGFDARVDARDLRETYLPAFRACVVEAGAASVMGAYNRVNGQPACASSALLGDTLRGAWGFEGYVVSDCFAIADIHQDHGAAAGPAEAGARALKAGCDLNCGYTFGRLSDALERGLIDEADLDRALRRLFTARLRLGMFDPPAADPWAGLGLDDVDTPAHRALALEAARAGLVLLENDGLLPLAPGLGEVAVIGPNADDREALLGNYRGTPAGVETPLAALRALLPGARVTYARGCHRHRPHAGDYRETDPISEAVARARRADAVILCLGLSPALEGEEGDAEASDAGGDRARLALPGLQQRLLDAVLATGTPAALALFGGSPVLPDFTRGAPGATLMAFYPGQAGGRALAEVLTGRVNPAGRLPVTSPDSVDDLPPFEDYAMDGRTYRFSRAAPRWPFGHGLSYTRFAYEALTLTASRIRAGEAARLTVRVRNVGERAGEEVVQVYVRRPRGRARHDLRGVMRVALAPGEAVEVALTLDARGLSVVDEDGVRRIPEGAVEVFAGGGQPGFAEGKWVTLTIEGAATLAV